MKQRHLKTLRVIVALLFFIPVTLLFLDAMRLGTPGISNAVTYLQFLPSLVSFIQTPGLAAAGFLFVLLFTLLFGRVFCSTVCPLGTLQDGVSRIAQRRQPPKRVRYHYTRPQPWLHYGLLLVTLTTFLSGSLLIVNLLDPFSAFGRIAADLLRPLYVGLNDLAAVLFQSFGVYWIYPLQWYLPPAAALLIPLLFLGLVIWLSARHGRLYCNTVCPVGALLGLVARMALFKIRIERDACNLCAQCSIHCKAGCIHLKTKEVDFSRCVACYDCMTVCERMGVGYHLAWPPWRRTMEKAVEPVPASERRAFLRASLVTAAASLLPAGGDSIPAFPPEPSRTPVMPPGAETSDRFTRTCTACHLCISACPTQVLQPAFLEYGLRGILQPHLAYPLSYCHYECNACGEICPTGAIQPLAPAIKQITQIGVAKFIKELCIVHTDHTICGACDERCPTKAIQMVPYQGLLTIPRVREALCIGCGACEYACPVRPERAIVVASQLEHQLAAAPETPVLETPAQSGFPF